MNLFRKKKPPRIPYDSAAQEPAVRSSICTGEMVVGFPIEFRLSGDEFVDGGYHLDEGIRIAQAIEEYVDLIHVTAGTYQKTFGITHPSWFEEHGRNVYLAAEIKKHVKKPVATIGGLSDPAMMEEIIASGKADVVEMARQLLADNQLPNKVMENRDDEIVRCLRCFTCMAERASTFTRRCTVNPLIGRELAVCLAREGKKVHLVEMREALCPDANVRYRPLLMAELKKNHVEVHTSCKCESAGKDSVVCSTADGAKVSIPGDSILSGLGLKPNTAVVEELCDSAPKFFAIGNCVRPDTITHAVYQGYHAALDI